MPSRQALLALLLAAAPPAQAARHVSRDGSFSLVLPPRWRQLTPDEARSLAAGRDPSMPADVVAPRPAAFYPYGDVDRWLARGFDGRCLTVQRAEGEATIDQDGLARVRAGTVAGAGLRREVLSARIAALGPAKHPVLECDSRLQLGEGTRWQRCLELFVPTGGDTLLLAFRAFEDDFAAALPELRAAADTLAFARPGRGPRRLGQRLLYPAMIGALVGVLLLVLRKKAS